MNEYVQSLKKLKLKYWTMPCQEHFKLGAGDSEVCETAFWSRYTGLAQSCEFPWCRES